jgi:hypothetical protein
MYCQRQWVGWILSRYVSELLEFALRAHVVVVSPYHANVWRNCPQVLKRLLVTDISGAYYLLNLSWNLPRALLVFESLSY